MSADQTDINQPVFIFLFSWLSGCKGHSSVNASTSSVPSSKVSWVSAVQIKGNRLHAGRMFEWLCLGLDTCVERGKARGGVFRV